jgi:hypothetical protein
MSIAGTHYYRCVYLKSEEWQTVRIEAMARDKGKCQICGVQNFSNEAHHVWYPESAWDTKVDHLAILCRACHDFIHTMMPECKTNDEELGRAHWLKFRNALMAWRAAKWDTETFSEATPMTSSGLRERFLSLKAENKRLMGGGSYPDQTKTEVARFLKDIRMRLGHFERKICGSDNSKQDTQQ